MFSKKELKKATDKVNEALVRTLPSTKEIHHNFSTKFENCMKQLIERPQNATSNSSKKAKTNSL